MTRMAGAQLAFDFPALARDPTATFVAGPSTAAARAALAAWRSWPTHALAVVGPARSGKSHLVRMWAEAEADAAAARILDGRDRPLDPTALEALEMGGRLVVEGADDGAPDAVFALINAARRGAGALVMTARCAPNEWAAWGATADLTSRLRALPMASIDPPDDDELRAILAKVFADSGVTADESLLSYICVRIERSHAAAVDAADGLTRRALADGARVTRALARDYFHEEGSGAL